MDFVPSSLNSVNGADEQPVVHTKNLYTKCQGCGQLVNTNRCVQGMCLAQCSPHVGLTKRQAEAVAQAARASASMCLPPHERMRRALDQMKGKVSRSMEGARGAF
jgi:hypothetical protein